MKQVSFLPDSAQTTSARSPLDVARIASAVRNEALSRAVTGMPSNSGLWVRCDDDYHEDARLLILSGSAPREPE
jgi:hypothetical protein